jgi:hypothetical protein
MDGSTNAKAGLAFTGRARLRCHFVFVSVF